MRAIADALQVERLAVWGISGGGPHALACAALLPDRVAAVASLASVAPMDAADLDWFGGMGQTNLNEFGAAVDGREALEEYLGPRATHQVTAEGLLEGLQSLLTDVDATVLTGDLGRYLAESMQDAGREGARTQELHREARRQPRLDREQDRRFPGAHPGAQSERRLDTADGRPEDRLR